MMLLPIIIVGLIFIYMNSSDKGSSISFAGDKNNALNILNKRFANGEIGEEEYLKRKSILSQKN